MQVNTVSRAKIALLALAVAPAISGAEAQVQEAPIRLSKVAEIQSTRIWEYTRALVIDSTVYVAPLTGGGIAAFDFNGEKKWDALPAAGVDDWNSSIHHAGDTIFFFAPADGMVYLLGRNGLEFGSRFVLPGWFHKPLGEGSLAITYHDRSPERFGYPLHVVQGGTIKSLGYDRRTLIAGREGISLVWGLVGGSSDSTFWSHQIDRVSIREWFSDGRGSTGRELAGVRDWLPFASSNLGEALTPRLHAVHHQGGETMLLLGHRTAVKSSQDGNVMPTPTVKHQALDSVLELISGPEGRTLQAGLFDTVLSGFSSSRTAYSVHGDGPSYTLAVWEIHLLNAR